MARVGKGRGLREAFWREKIADQAGSGLNVSAYCRREGLSANSFYGWRRALHSSGDDGPGPGVGGPSRPGVGGGVFAPLVVTGPEGGGMGSAAVGERECVLEVVLPCGLFVRVRPGFDAATLTRLVAALAAGRC
jgi:transposase